MKLRMFLCGLLALSCAKPKEPSVVRQLIGPGVIGPVEISLPTCDESRSGMVFLILDGLSPDDCSLGGGTKDNVCYCDGKTWRPVSAKVGEQGTIEVIWNAKP